MKTAKEYIEEMQNEVGGCFADCVGDNIEVVERYFNGYAEQAIEMCASSAMVKTEGITQDDEEGSIHYFSVVDEESILKVKDLLI